jgi:transposase
MSTNAKNKIAASALQASGGLTATTQNVAPDRVALAQPHGYRRKGRVPLADITEGTLILLGLDVHSKQTTVVRQIDHSLPQPAQRFDQDGLLAWVAKMIAQGAEVWSCYEAGCFGYVLHRQLQELGVINLVVTPEALNGRNKTDKRDARELCLRLERYHGGNTRVFSVVRVPTVEEERRRETGRQRQRLLKERMRSEKRGASLLLLEGHKVTHGWWKPARWTKFAPELDEGLRERVGLWQQQALMYERKQRELTRALEDEVAASVESLPAGLGKLTWRLLCGEILTWKRFNNRRQVGSYTGLCPGEDSSGESRRQGPINRHGNPRVRTLLVEAVWRLTRFEPAWRGFEKFPELFDKKAGSRKRRRLVVAAARLLAIDLWRLETGQTDAAKLGFKQSFTHRTATPESS